MELWERVLRSNDKAKAKELTTKTDAAKTSKEVEKILGYVNSMTDNEGYYTSRARRILTELKILSNFGQHFFMPYLVKGVNNAK